MAVTPYPGYGNGGYGGTMGEASPPPQLGEFTQVEEPPEWWVDTNGNGITQDYTKTDAILTGDKRRRAYMIALITVGILTVIR